MRKAKSLVEGAILMEGAFRGPEHPHGPLLELDFALVKAEGGGLQTCGKVKFASPGSFDMWPEGIKEQFNNLVEALEEHFIRYGGVFEADEEEIIHAAIVTGSGGAGEPEEF